MADPIEPRVSASTTDAPPCSRPNGWVLPSTGMVATTRSAATSTSCTPIFSLRRPLPCGQEGDELLDAQVGQRRGRGAGCLAHGVIVSERSGRRCRGWGRPMSVAADRVGGCLRRASRPAPASSCSTATPWPTARSSRCRWRTSRPPRASTPTRSTASPRCWSTCCATSSPPTSAVAFDKSRQTFRLERVPRVQGQAQQDARRVRQPAAADPARCSTRSASSTCRRTATRPTTSSRPSPPRRWPRAWRC